MTDNNHYPFTGSTVVLHKLKVLDEAIIDYVRWKLQLPLGSEQKGTITESTFKEVLQQRTMLLKRKPDVMANPEMRMKTPSFG